MRVNLRENNRPKVGGVEFIAENGGGAGVRLRTASDICLGRPTFLGSKGPRREETP